VDDTFFGADPAELGVGDEVAPCGAPVGDEGGEGTAGDAGSEGGDGGANDVVAAADGEGLGGIRDMGRSNEGIVIMRILGDAVDEASHFA
jgi:hypothetical protein